MPWTPAPLIDPQLGLSGADRRSVCRAAWTEWMSTPRNSVLYAAGLIVALSMFLFVPDVVEPWFGGHRSYFWLIWLGVYVLGLFGLFMILRRYGFAPCVYAELRGRGHDVCHRCGYVLADLPADRARCPECGAERRPIGGPEGSESDPGGPGE